MGVQFFDQYSYLHFSTGVIAFFWNIGILNWALAHTLFEIVENTDSGMNVINQYIPFWPGGKYQSDLVINMIGDTVFAILGWYSAKLINQIGIKYKWYQTF